MKQASRIRNSDGEQVQAKLGARSQQRQDRDALRRTVSGAQPPGLEFSSSHLLAVWLYRSYLVSLCPSFSMCQLETVTEYGPYRVPGKTKWIQTGKALRTVPVTVSTTITKRVWEKWTEGRTWNFFLHFAVLSQWQHMHFISPFFPPLPSPMPRICVLGLTVLEDGPCGPTE